MAGIAEPSQPLKREHLGDKMIMIDAKETPLLSTLPKGGSFENMLFEIPLDKYSDVDTAGTPDGADVSSFEDKSEHRQKTGVRAQWFRKSWKVGKLAQTVSNVAGVSDEVATSKAKCVTELKRNIEARFGGSDDGNADTGNGSKTRALGSWIATGAQSDQPVPTDYRATAGQISTTAMASTTDTTIRDILKTIYGQSGGASGYMAYCGETYKGMVSDLAKYDTVPGGKTAIRGFEQGKQSAMIHDTVDVYKSDFGTATFLIDLWLGYSGNTQTNGDTLCYYLNKDYVHIKANQQIGHTPLPDLGGGQRGFCDAIMGLCVDSPQAHGKHAATS